GVGGLDRTQLWRRLELVDTIDEHHAGIADGPRRVGDRIEDTARVELAGDDTGPWVHEIVGRPGLHRLHERVGDGDGEVEVDRPTWIELDGDELEDVRVVDAEHPHVRTAPRPALLDGLGRHVEHLHQRHGTRGVPAGRGHEVTGWPEPGERKSRTAARLLDLGRPARSE